VLATAGQDRDCNLPKLPFSRNPTLVGSGLLSGWRLNGQVVEVAFSGVNTHLQSEVDQRKARLPVPNPDVLADLLNKWITVVENNPPTVGIFECLALAEPIWILRMDGRTTG
jgi:hypothetical protein